MSTLRPHRLSSWLLFSAALVALVPALLLTGVALHDLSSRERERATERSAQLAHALAGELRRFIDGQIVEFTALRIEAEGHFAGDRSHLAAHLRSHSQANPALLSIQLVDSSGRVVIADPPDPDVEGTDLSGQPWLKEARERGLPVWSAATISSRTSKPSVTLVVPGQRWSVVCYIDLGTLADVIGRVRGGQAATATVLDHDGTIIAAHEPRLVRERASLREIPLVRQALLGQDGGAVIALAGQQQLASVATVPHTGWVVLVAEPVEASQAVVGRSRLILLAVLVGGLLAAGLAGRLLARRILGPVRALSERTRALASGEPVPSPADVGTIRFRELEALSAAFDSMAQRVRSREAALQRSEASYRRIVSTSLVGVASTSLEGEIHFANETMARILGAPSAEALRGRRLTDFFQDVAHQRQLVDDLKATGQVANREVALLTVTGGPRTGLLNVARDGDTLIGLVVDVSDLKRSAAEHQRLEQQLERAQRVEAVGRLAGGVAHDLNNVLTAVIGFGHLLAEALPATHPERESVDGILEAAGRAAALTRSLLTFARKNPLQPRPVDLGAVVRGVASMLRNLLGEDIEFTMELPDEPLVTVADPARLEQVLVNLGTNARDAMPGGGRLTIAVARAALGQGEAAALGLDGPGPWITVTMRDSGLGMSAEVLRQAFEPFFTTKESGKGAGLGLSIVHGIVRQHGGVVTVATTPGAGTTFTIYLPASDERVEAPALPENARAGPGGSETILVAEDEVLVRQVVTTTLRKAGYRVIEAVDGADAVARFREQRDAVDLCLLDVIMPKLNGREALAAIRLITPGVRVLLASGFTGSVLDERGLDLESVGLLQKPMAPAELLRRVRSALDRS